MKFRGALVTFRCRPGPVYLYSALETAIWCTQVRTRRFIPIMSPGVMCGPKPGPYCSQVANHRRTYETIEEQRNTLSGA